MIHPAPARAAARARALHGRLALLARPAAALAAPASWASWLRFQRNQACVYAADKAGAAAAALEAIVAQHAAMADVAEAVAAWEGEFDESPRPLVLVLTGPTGTGKSETAHLLAEALLVGPRHEFRVEGFLELRGEDFVDAGAGGNSSSSLLMQLKTRIATTLYQCRGHAVVVFEEAQKAAHGVLGALTPLLQGRRAHLQHPDVPHELDARKLVLIVIADVGNKDVELFIAEELDLQARAAAAAAAATAADADANANAGAGAGAVMAPARPVDTALLQQKLRARMRKRLTEEFSRSAHGVDLGALADHIVTYMPFNQSGVRALLHRLVDVEVRRAFVGRGDGFADALEVGAEVVNWLSLGSNGVAYNVESERCKQDVVAVLRQRRAAAAARKAAASAAPAAPPHASASAAVSADGIAAAAAAAAEDADDASLSSPPSESPVCGEPCDMPRSCFVSDGARSIGAGRGESPVSRLLRVLRRAREAFLNEDGGGAAGAHAVLRLGMDCFAPERFDRTCGLASMKGVRLRVERCESVRPAPSRGKGKKGGTSTEVCTTIFAGQI